jgi:hypothetical protein
MRAEVDLLRYLCYEIVVKQEYLPCQSMAMTSSFQDLRISVAIVTRNRIQSLERTLRSLRAQTVQPWEIVVSDDSGPEVATEVHRLARSFECRYTEGPKRGLYANRNHVALTCSGTHIRTIDDDHEFPSGHMDHCMEAVTDDPNSIWLISEYLPTADTRDPLPIPGELHARGFSVKPKNPDDCWAMSDGASIFPASMFKNGIRYAEFFKFGAAYLEFGSRLRWLGYRLRLLHSTYVIHHFDAAKRSFLDERMDLGSRMFASLCHSFIYQPSPANQLLCIAEIGRQIVFHRGWQAFRLAEPAYRDHREAIRKS